MIVREFTERDLKQVESLHRAQGFSYDLPDISKMAVATVVESEGTIVSAAMLRPTTECYLICDPSWGTPRWRWESFLTIHEIVRQQAEKKEIEDVNMWCPPRIDKSFGKRLLSLGWRRNEWPTYSRQVKP